MRTYNFHTIINGRRTWEQVQGRTLGEAIAMLRGNLRDGETVEGLR